MTRRRFALTLLFAAACTPTFDDGLSRVDGPRILAVRVEPPDAKPGEKVTIQALSSDGALVAYDFCLARRALAEPGSVSAACLDDPAGRVALGVGARVTGEIPTDACRLFGPDRPVGRAGEPAARPADADSTGGYYQPGTVRGGGAAAASFDVRIRCGLPGATQGQLAEYERRYRPNRNPEIAALFVRVAGAATEQSIADGDRVNATRGATLVFRVAWPDCTTFEPCAGAERYVAFDPQSRSVVDRREAMRASWLATGGRFETDGTGRAEDDAARDTENTWIAPSSAGLIRAWVVVRDARGGAGFRSLSIDVN